MTSNNLPNPPSSPSIDTLNQLTEQMHHAEKKRTLEEQVAYLKSQGIDPSKTYRTWDDEDENDD